LRKAKAFRYLCKYKEALAALDQALGMEGVEDDYVKSVKLELEEELKNENVVSSDSKEKKEFAEFHEHALKNGVVVNKSKVQW
jgi:hypothetical protein